ncbi:MAG: phytoene desaturase family protein [Pseudomonadota bacterium]|nr:phytoene desaturase family protein [Pseudomonadota bacterium]
MGKKNILVVGSGIAGLTGALKLAHSGHSVRVVERHPNVGGKLRNVPSFAGPVDAGPTVFTLKHLFDELFAEVDEKLENHLELIEEPILARHFWPDGSRLDLFSNFEKNMLEIKNFSGKKSAYEFKNFSLTSEKLFSCFEKPILKSMKPSLTGAFYNSLIAGPKIMRLLATGKTLHKLVASEFSDPRLQQLFSRYATYVGGSPFASPAILALIWHVETLGVWRVKGGLSELARTLKRLCEQRNVIFTLNKNVLAINASNGQVTGARIDGGEVISADQILFNGDPAAIYEGLFGPKVEGAVPQRSVKLRSLSAYVWSFGAETNNKELAHHNVFFNDNYRSEFDDINQEGMPRDPSLYVCAEDRGTGKKKTVKERFEIIMNAAPIIKGKCNFSNSEQEFLLCKKRTFDPLSRRGLTFKELPRMENLTTPTNFHEMFPATQGSLYGLSPSSLMATFRRPSPQTKIKGLYLAGGGVHPGPGVPMAMLSGKHAAETMLRDRIST